MKQNFFVWITIFLFSVLFFSYRLLDVPRGITADEAAFGYNASLISETGRDENNRFLPVFVLSLYGRDWRQPVAQYLDVAAFRVFGRSLFILKFVSVLTASISALLILLLATRMFGAKFGWASLLIFVTIPVIVIHSHLALDNITPVPFVILWLVGLYKFREKRTFRYLILSGISLGLGFYAHKSMRSAATVWSILTVLFLSVSAIKNRKRLTFKNYKPVILFFFSIIPFYLISPVLDYKYAGAVYGKDAIAINSVYDFFDYYLSSFDLSFLFVSGDSILHHSTGYHGMFLLSTLPLFVYGIYKSIRDKERFIIFLVICFFSGPLLFGLVGSVHRASRLLFLTPLFALISTYGAAKLSELRGKNIKTILLGLSLILVINFFDFINYYWFHYADNTYQLFYSTESIGAYKKLKEVSTNKKLNPLISDSLLQTSGDPGTVSDFARSLYFTNPAGFDDKSNLPERSIILTQDKDFQGRKIETVKDYFLYTNP